MRLVHSDHAGVGMLELQQAGAPASWRYTLGYNPAALRRSTSSTRC